MTKEIRTSFGPRPPVWRNGASAPSGTASSHHGFTLIEVLVVIAILVLLAAILFPVFAAARAKAWSSSCSSNLHQLGLVFQMYQQDNDGVWPGSVGFGHGFGTFCSWPEYVYYDYVKSTDIFHCPANVRGYYAPGCVAPTTDSTNFGSYTMTVLHGFHPRVLESTFTHPAGTIVLFDGAEFGSSDPTMQGTEPLQSVADLQARAVSTFHHYAGANVLFADGHGKWLHATKMLETSLWVVGDPP